MRHRELFDLCDPRRHEYHRAAAGELGADPRFERAVEHSAATKHNQKHQAGATWLIFGVLLDRHRFGHLDDALQDAVDLRWADADPADVEDAVGTAVETRAALRRELDQVAVGPDAGILAEVGFVESATVLVAETSTS